MTGTDWAGGRKSASGLPLAALSYREIWVVDFEFIANDGDRPIPVCMVAKELRSGRTIRLWQDQLRGLEQAPFDAGPDALFVAYFASAEIGCFEALGWPYPERIVDLFCEFRAATNGAPPSNGNGLLGALLHHGLTAMLADDKTVMRDLIMAGGPWSDDERAAILAYCEDDVVALERLLPAMVPEITSSPLRLGWALLRGRYMAAIARMEWNGIPIDVSTLRRLKENWPEIKNGLIAEVDRDFGVYEGQSFRSGRFEAYLTKNEIPWPRLVSGALALNEDTFRQQAKAYPVIAPLRELRHSLSELRLNKLQVGRDGRNRTLLSPFSSKTGRNQPSNSKFIFGPSVWLRGLIKPPPGRAIAYLDWKSQEIAIAAALSEDEALWDAYMTGDPYMAFAKQAGFAPADATKESHGAIRDRCKAIVLGVQYGMAAEGLAARAGLHVVEARELLQRHKETYRAFWCWADQNVNAALTGATLYTRFGWPIRIGFGTAANPRSLLNWPMQANGAEMMRLACMMATEAGLMICAPIHDALLLEAPADEINDHVARLTATMQKASELVLGKGRVCGVDMETVTYPDHYSDKRGWVMWERVMKLIDAADRARGHEADAA
jgi:DNA polymerase I